MKRDEILDEWTQDAPIYPTHLEAASINLPKLQSKYLRYRSQERMVLLHLENEYKRLYVHRFDLFQGGESKESIEAGIVFPHKGTPLVKEIEKYLEIDAEIQKKATAIGIQKEKIAILEDILRTLASRNFTISNIIKLRELESGR